MLYHGLSKSWRSGQQHECSIYRILVTSRRCRVGMCTTCRGHVRCPFTGITIYKRLFIYIGVQASGVHQAPPIRGMRFFYALELSISCSLFLPWHSGQSQSQGRNPGAFSTLTRPHFQVLSKLCNSQVVSTTAFRPVAVPWPRHMGSPCTFICTWYNFLAFVGRDPRCDSNCVSPKHSEDICQHGPLHRYI